MVNRESRIAHPGILQSSRRQSIFRLKTPAAFASRFLSVPIRRFPMGDSGLTSELEF